MFLFRSRKADYLKILHYDGTGLCLFANRVASYCISCRLM
ncbi:IS66 family insertion sequence element accessory protein TnpB [Mycobacterium sp. KBS0706]